MLMDRGRSTAEGWGWRDSLSGFLHSLGCKTHWVLSSIRLFFSMAFAFAFAFSQKKGQHAGGEGINQRLQPASIHLYLFIPAEALLCFALLSWDIVSSCLSHSFLFWRGPFSLFLQPTYIPHCFIHPFVLSVTYLLTYE